MVCTVRKLGISRQRLDCGFQVRSGCQEGSGCLWLSLEEGNWKVTGMGMKPGVLWKTNVPHGFAGTGPVIRKSLPEGGSVLGLRFVFGVCFLICQAHHSTLQMSYTGEKDVGQEMVGSVSALEL